VETIFWPQYLVEPPYIEGNFEGCRTTWRASETGHLPDGVGVSQDVGRAKTLFCFAVAGEVALVFKTSVTSDTYLPDKTRVLSRSKDNRQGKIFDALDWPAAMPACASHADRISHIPKYREQ